MISNKKPVRARHIGMEPVQEPSPKEKVKAPEPDIIMEPLGVAKPEGIVENAEIPVAPVGPTTHYFYCQKADGTKVTYKRNMQSKSYIAEIASFRKSLEAQGTVIISEEQK